MMKINFFGEIDEFKNIHLYEVSTCPSQSGASDSKNHVLRRSEDLIKKKYNNS